MNDVLNAYNAKQFSKVKRLCLKALKKTPHSAFYNSMLGAVLLEEDSYARAVPYFRKALILDPNPSAEYNLARALYLSGGWYEAKKLLTTYLSRMPKDPDGWTNLGLVNRSLGEMTDAIHAFRQAYVIGGASLDSVKNLALAYAEKKDYAKASRLYEEMVEKDRDNPLVIAAYARFLAEIRRIEHAFYWVQEALALDSANPVTNLLFAKIIVFNSVSVDPGPYLKVAAANKVTSEAACRVRLLQLFGKKQYAELMTEINSIDRGLLRNESFRDFLSEYAVAVAIRQFDMAWFKKIQNTYNLNSKALQTDIFSGAHYFDSVSALRRCVEVSVARVPSCGDFETLNRQVKPNSPIRIGFFSGEFSGHPVGKLFIKVFENLTKNKIECIVFSNVSVSDEWTERYKNAAAAFHDVTGLSDWEVVHLARRECLDIAFDLNGHTGDHRLAIFKARVSNVQVSYLGFPCTTGLHQMDYVLLDENVFDACNQKLFVEKCVTLDRCFMPRDPSVKAQKNLKRECYNLPNNAFVFCVFNKASKFSERTIKIVSEIAIQTGGVLWFSAMASDAEAKIAQIFCDRGVKVDQIIFASRVESDEEHLGRLALADLYLDTYPYGGHTSFGDALYAGLPALTLYGESPVSRVGLSYLRHLGLSDQLAFRDESCMVKAAHRLFEQPEALNELRELLDQRVHETRLFDVDDYVSHFLKMVDFLVVES